MRKNILLILFVVISSQFSVMCAKEAHWVKFVPSFAQGFIPEHAKQEKHCCKHEKKEADWVQCVPAFAQGYIPEHVKQEKLSDKDKKIAELEAALEKEKSKKYKKKSKSKEKAVSETQSVVVDVKSSNYGLQGKTSTGDITRFGMANIRNELISGSVTVMGPASFYKVKISKDCDIRGNAQFDDVTVDGKLLMMGPLSGNDITVKGDSAVYGCINAQSSTFKYVKVKKKNKEKYKKNLEIVFKDCTLSSLDVKAKITDGYIELHDTIVRGDVQFTKKQGCIKLFGKSKIEGKVINGTTEVVS